jgi:hypothetical protein
MAVGSGFPLKRLVGYLPLCGSPSARRFLLIRCPI